MYYPRLIDQSLAEWASRTSHKPLLLRGARQVGKSTAVRHLGHQFETFVELNLEKQPAYKQLFQGDIDVERIVPLIGAMAGKSITADKTLLFIDEIQECPEAIMALRFFCEDMPELHVVAAGSLLEFVLEDLPTFGVGRIHSMFMYPMTFDEFLLANGEQALIAVRNQATASAPLAEPIYQKLVGLFRTFLLVGGMPEAVAMWVETRDYARCQEVLDDIVVGYEDDFAKYAKKADPTLLRLTLRSAAVQATRKFVFAEVGGGYRAQEVKRALELLIRAGILIPVTCTSANGQPLGSGSDLSYRKMLLLDTGLMLRLLSMAVGDIRTLTQQILTANVADLVNKGPMAELVAGLELLHYASSDLRHDLYYWLRMARNSSAEIDYITTRGSEILPIEVKAGMQGGMKSLWLFLREKHLTDAVRCSMENFGTFDFVDREDGDAVRHVRICPLFALSQLNRLME